MSAFTRPGPRSLGHARLVPASGSTPAALVAVPSVSADSGLQGPTQRTRSQDRLGQDKR